jgi:hypothetical protein
VAVRTLTHARARTRTGRSFLPVLVIWSSWLVLMTGANLATPLYAVYASTFGFSSLVLTSIFATCAFVLVPSLVVLAGWGRWWPRRRSARSACWSSAPSSPGPGTGSRS